MVTQAPKRSAVLIAVAFALSCVGLMVFTWTQFGGTIPFRPQGYRIHALFNETGLLVPNADVRISGVDVGKVSSVEAKGTKSLVTLDINRQYAPIPADTRAILREKTLLGEAYIGLSSGTGAGPKIPDGGAILSSHIDDTQALDKVLASFDAPTQKALQNFLNGTFDALAGRGRDLNNAFGNLDPAVTELTALVNVLNEQQGNVQRLISNSGTVLTTLGDRSAALQQLVTSGEQVFAATAARNTALTQTVDALPPFLAQLRSTLGTLNTTLGIAGPTLRVLKPVAPLVPPALQDIIKLSDPAVRLLKQAPSLLRTATTALPSITRFMKAFKPAVDKLLPAVEQVAPMIDVVANYRNELIAGMANLGAVLQAQSPANTTAAVDSIPAGTAKYLRAVIPINDESIFGQSHRPPTNRHNAYYAPGALSNLATGLESSDCNNTGNTAEVPLPLGSGNVPCKVQGPWTFNGVTAYFPHLTAKPPVK
jgi:phospholipid/cholesterol/gamma-HCH transport system substrate-binding protein